MAGTLYEIRLVGWHKWENVAELGEYQIIDGRPSFWPKGISTIQHRETKL
jgi:hypothetical protein